MSSDDDFTNSQLNPLVGKRQYLVTYSQADETIFPTKQSFGEAVANAFNTGSGKVKVEYWASCKEIHKNAGFHYHCTLKLSGSKKWLSVKRQIAEKHGIQVNFSDKHDFYLSAYRYICKTDKDVYHSQNHPKDLLEKRSPLTKSCTRASIEANRKRRSVKSNSTTSAKAKIRRLSALDTSELIKKENIKCYDGLLAVAKTRYKSGQSDLTNYIMNKSEKQLREIICKTWQLESACAVVETKNLGRLDMLRSHLTTPCEEPCNGKWLQLATEVLTLNGIPLSEFSNALRNLLILGRGKHRNLLIFGPADCAKTFILKPLQIVYKDCIFQNPSKDKYSWIGADKAKVILLNDFRFEKEQIAWKDLLLLLEGEPVRLPAPKNLFAEDVSISSDVPIFATSKGRIRYRGAYMQNDEVEDEMMRVRWKTFNFSHVFEEKDKKKVEPCPKCFAKLVFP